jgi:flagellar P-ring protein precursor FlgI
MTSLSVSLKTPDFSTASRVERAINVAMGSDFARMMDSGTIALDLSATTQPFPAHLLARIENLLIEPDAVARVVVDQRSGTIVISENVRVSRVAVSKGNLTLRVEEQPIAVQPNPFSEGDTVIVPRTAVGVGNETAVSLAEVPVSTTLSDVVSGLNALGITPNDMIDILKTIKAAGALHAEFIVM